MSRRPVLAATLFEQRMQSARGHVAVARATKRPGDRKRQGMNQTERRYADHLDTLCLAGVLSEWHYESLTLKLGDDCRLTPDFLVVTDAGELELHEVKGAKRGQTETFYAEDDAKVKLRTCARQFPFRLIVTWPSSGGGWHRQEIGA